MILTVTPNPSIDKAILVPGYRLGGIHRPERVVAVAGGKGLNVSRTIKQLGGEVRACVLLAGHNGHWIEEQLAGEEIPASIAWAEGETRSCYSVIDPLNRQLTEVYEKGPTIDLATWRKFESVFEASLVGANWVALSGSLPPGAPQDSYARLHQLAHAQGVPVLVDTHGDPLRQVLNLNPWLIKLNAAEAGELLGEEIDSLAKAVAALQKLRQIGASSAVITLGVEGAVAVDAAGVWVASPPPVEALAPVGSGDAFFGGLILGIARGISFPDALRLGTAAGAANTQTLGTGLVEKSLVIALVEKVQVKPYD